MTGARRYGIAAAGLAALALLYGPFLWRHARHAADPNLFNDGTPQFVAPFLVDDYVSRYYLTYLFAGYKVLYRASAWLVDPVTLSKVLPYVLLLGLLAAMWLAARRLGGTPAALGAVALALSSGVFLDRLVGASPRSFGFPLIAATVAALVAGRMGWLAATVVLGAAFYPPAGVVAGVALAMALLVLPPGDRGDAAGWSPGRRLMVLGGAALGAGAVLLPGFLATGYGPKLGPADVARFPEVGLGGRYFPIDVWPFQPATLELWDAVAQALTGAGPPWMAGLRAWAEPRADLLLGLALALAVAGIARLAWREPAARRFAVFAAAAALAYGLAFLIYPALYLPPRYLSFAVPVLVLIGLPVGAGALAAWAGRHPAAGPASALLAAAVWLALMGGRGDDLLGFTARVRLPALYAFLRAEPAGTRVAGWPGEEVELVRVLARHPTLVGFKTHEVFHLDYVVEMRRRMRAQIDATFATDLAPLRRLYEEWEITHLIVNLGHYGGGPPQYFVPFEGWAREAWARGRAAGFEPLRQLPRAAVWAQGPIVILDLRRLPAG